ncbi:amidase family protein [Coniella lustricola]|uniref:Amidase family protein n=1 Tax=Coniella lustricola TaxID=2025994 RepID=A0A2T3AM04_9PEZI|nr:amidase family protein [Coniella lustricola]
MAADHTRSFWGYPVPIKGPYHPYKAEKNSNPALRGWILVPATYVMEYIRPVREYIWANAGFSSLRDIRLDIEHYEPLHDPTVVPLDHKGPQANGNGSNQATTSRANIGLDGSSTSASSSSSSSSSNDNKDLEDHGLSTAPSPPPSKPLLSPNVYYSASTYRNLYLAGELTPTDVANALLPLIRRDIEPKGEHHLYFFDSKADLVLQAAEASTQRYRENRSLGPLDGVPCAVKDEYDVEGYKSCLGSVNDYTAEPRESTDSEGITNWLVTRLLAAGVVLIGITSMHEFGLDTTGNQPVYGTPRNPFHAGYYTGGSSSGTGGAVGLGLIPIGLGSDGGGSIRIPASYCNVFGLKPTHNRLSFYPGENHCNSCAVLGPLACDIESLAQVFEAIAEPHPTSVFAAPLVPRLPPAREMLTVQRHSGKKLGIVRAWFDDCAPAVRQLCHGMVDRLVAERGYEVIDIDIPFLKAGQSAHALTVLTDASTLLPEYGNLTWANRILLALGRTARATDYVLAQKLRRCLVTHLSYLWTQHPGLLIVTPTTACAGWPIRSGASSSSSAESSFVSSLFSELRYGVSDGDRTMESMRYVWMANLCGLPSISVPAGFASATGDGERVFGEDETDEREKVPVGLMATGEWAAEKLLLEFGVEAEVVGRRVAQDKDNGKAKVKGFAGAGVRPARWVDVVELARAQKRSREHVF